MKSRVISRPPTVCLVPANRFWSTLASLHQSHNHLRYRCDVHDVLCRPVRDSAWQEIAASTHRDALRWQDSPRPRIRPIQLTARLRQDLHRLLWRVSLRTRSKCEQEPEQGCQDESLHNVPPCTSMRSRNFVPWHYLLFFARNATLGSPKRSPSRHGTRSGPSASCCPRRHEAILQRVLAG